MRGWGGGGSTEVHNPNFQTCLPKKISTFYHTSKKPIAVNCVYAVVNLS